MNRFRSLSTPLLMLILLSASCVSMQGQSGKDRSGSRTKMESIVHSKSTYVQDLIKTQNYDGALVFFDQLWANRDERQIGEYRNLAEKLRSDGDREYELGNFAQAGSIYNLLLQSRIATENSNSVLSLSPEYLKKQIRACSKALTELGIIKYREQKLNDAIAIWQQILQFEPRNRTITKAIATASRQQYTLRQIK